MSNANDSFYSQLLGDVALPRRVESIVALPLERVVPGSAQPRTHFDEASLAELAASIRNQGVLEPVLVRKQGNQFEIIAGERRCRAAKLAGLTEVPAVVRDFSDQEARVVALLENLQREDLNPVEETEAILELLALRLGETTQGAFRTLERVKNERLRDPGAAPEALPVIEEVFGALGRNWQSFLRNQARLITLPSEVYRAVREGRLAYTKALALAKLDDEGERRALLERTISERLSVREVREAVHALQAKGTPETLRTTATERYKRLGKLLRRSAALNDKRQSSQILKLLDQLERLLDKSDG